MDPIVALRVARKELARLSRMLGVDHWSIRITAGADGDRACVYTRPEYERAEIHINPDEHGTEAEISESIRHELLHVVTSPLDLVHGSVSAIHPEGTPERLLLEEQFRLVAELLVVNTDRMYRAMLDHRGGKGKAR